MIQPQLYYLRLAGVLVFVAMTMTTFVSPVHGSDAEPVVNSWNRPGIVTEVQLIVPGTDGKTVDAPIADAADPLIFELRDACTNGQGVILPDCTIVIPDCAAGTGNAEGKAGSVFNWYFAKSGETPLRWTFYDGPVCVYGEKPRDILAEIAGQIAHEFQQTPIAAADFGSQPGPHTLRGKETNVWAEATTQTFNLTLLGQSVTITATPAAYTWDYGDGATWGPTPVHGAPLHEDRIGEQTQTSHIYTETGRLAINLTTHFNGTYTVNGGPDLPIPGQGNIPSPALPLTVWRAETHLYADDCFQNPQGVGC